jgi:hypothetical protein
MVSMTICVETAPQHGENVLIAQRLHYRSARGAGSTATRSTASEGIAGTAEEAQRQPDGRNWLVRARRSCNF